MIPLNFRDTLLLACLLVGRRLLLLGVAVQSLARMIDRYGWRLRRWSFLAMSEHGRWWWNDRSLRRQGWGIYRKRRRGEPTGWTSDGGREERDGAQTRSTERS